MKNVVIKMIFVFTFILIFIDITIGQDNNEEIKPLIRADTEKGFIIANNLHERYFIFFLPGKELKIDVAGGNLIFFLDNNVIQLLTFDIDKNYLKQMTISEMLKLYAANEIDHLERSIGKKLELLDMQIIETKDKEKAYLIWGYVQPEELKTDSSRKAKYQIFMATILNKKIYLGFNGIVFENDDPKKVQEIILKICATAEAFDNPISEKTVKEYYDRVSSKF